MAIDKLVPRYLNLDDDERLVKSVEMTDAKNVHISVDDDNNAGVVKQAFGNAEVSPKTTADTVPSSGTNRIIGAVNFDADGVIFFFLWNSAKDHGVYMYESEQNRYVQIYENDALDFSAESHVQAEVVKSGNGDTLLYFTDGITEPKKINVSRFLSGSYETLATSTADAPASNYITVCKRPPVIPPTFRFVASSDENANNRVIDRVFQFACQYVYVDGEVSAIGPYSKLTYSDDHFNVDGTMADLYSTPFDSIDVTLTKATSGGAILDGDVKAVRFLARTGHSGPFVVFDEKDTDENVEKSVASFTNNKAYRFVGDQEISKLYDAVPLRASSLCVSDNRLFFGNYVDGFDTEEWPEAVKGNQLLTNSFPVTSGIETGVFTTADGSFDSVSQAGGDNKESHAIFVENDSNGGSQANMHYFAPNTTASNVATLGDGFDATFGYFGGRARDDSGSLTGFPKWHIKSDGDSLLESGEHTGRLGTSPTQPLNVEIDISSIPLEGFGTTCELTLTYFVTGGRCYLIPTYDQQDGRRELDIKYKPFFPGNNNVKSLTLKFFHGGESIGGDFASQFDDNEFHKVAGVCYVGANEDFSWQKQIQVQVNVQGTDTRATLAQKICDQIQQDNVKVEIVGNGGGTAHGNNYQGASLGIVDEVSGSKSCRYYLKEDGAGGGQSKIVLKPNGAVPSTDGDLITVNYVGRAAKFDFDTIAHNGPTAELRVNTILGVVTQPAGDSNRQSIESGPISISLPEGGSGIDGDDASTTIGAQGDLYRTFCLDWGRQRATGSILIGGASGVTGSDTGENRLTFRSGSHHPLGVVFYDHRNRSSSVKRLKETYIPFSGDATSAVGNEVNQLVPYDIDVVFDSAYIPSWAERYQIVYPGNSLYEFSLTHSVPEALVADMTKVVIRDPSFSDGENVDGELDSTGTDAQAQQNFPSLAAAESAGIVNNAIYLPFRFFEGKSDSYVSSKGAKLNYEFRPGDKVRIVSHVVDNDGVIENVYPQQHFFDVIGYKYFEPNSDRNVLVLPNQEDGNFTSNGEYRRSGWMLILRATNNFPGFSTADIRGSDSSLNKWRNNAVVEILRPKIAAEDDQLVYFEIGESFPVADDSRIDAVYSADATNGPVAFVGNNTIQTKQRLFAGDKIFPSSFPGEPLAGQNLESGQFFGVAGSGFGGTFTTSAHTHTVTRVLGEFFSDAGDGFTYYRYKVTPSGPGGSTNAFVGSTLTQTVTTEAAFCVFQKPNYRAVHLTNQGDSYFRKRDMRSSAFTNDAGFDPSDLSTSTSINYRLTNIEDPGFNDFLPSTVTRNYNYGRPHVYNPDFSTNVRGASVTYSDVYASDGQVLSLSSFNPSQFPFKDYSLRNGSIAAMFDQGSSITVLQERKVSQTPVSRDYIQTAEGGMLITSKNVLGSETYIPSDYGPGIFSRGCVEHDGVIYFADVEKGVVCAVAGNQISVISDKKVSNYFADVLQLVQSGSAQRACILGIHPNQDELVCSFSSLERRSISAGGDTFGRGLPMNKDTSTHFDLSAMKDVYQIKGSPLDLSNEKQNWNLHLLDWDEAGKGVVFTDHPSQIGFVEANLQTKNTHDFLVTNQRNDFYGKMVRQQGTVRKGILDETTNGGQKSGSSSTITKSSVVVAKVDSIAFNYKQGAWTSKYDFEPEAIIPCFENMLTFKAGVPYLHSPSATVATFYGVKKDVVVEVVSKVNPSMVKLYKALSLEGNSVWSAELSNKEQTSTITVNMWKDQDIEGNVRAGDGFREGMLYCDMPGDTSSTSHLDEIAIGVVASSGVDAENNRVTFTSRVDNLPFNIGDTLFDAADGATTSRTITGVHDRFTLNVSATGGLAAADNLIARNASDTGHVTGDPLRDYYLKIKLTNVSTVKNELYAVNAIFERSRLHNDRVN